MKRIVGAIVLTLLAGLYYCVYAVDSVNKGLKSALRHVRSGVSQGYHVFADFCYDIGGKLFSNHLNLSNSQWALIGFAAVMILFLILYFIIFGIIAHVRRKKKIARKRAEGDLDYEPDKFPTKRLLFAIIIVGLAAYAFCVYAVPSVNSGLKSFINAVRRLSAKVYYSFEKFCFSSAGFFSNSLQAKLSPEMWTLLFLIAFAVLFFIIYFIVFGLIARSQKRRHERKVKEFEERSRKLESKPVENKVTKASSTVTVNATRPVKQFYWQDYIGGRPIKRVIFAIVLSLLVLALLALRFFYYFNSEQKVAIAALSKIYEFMDPMFIKMDSVEKALFSFGEKTNIVTNFMNNQAFTLMNLFDFIFWLLVGVVFIVIVILICTMFVHIFRKSFARKRARKAEAKYLSELTSLPKEERLYASAKAGEQLGIPTSKREGADIAKIADISEDKLSSAMADDGKASDYIDDIGEGVSYVGLAQPIADETITIHEVRESLAEELLDENNDNLETTAGITVEELNTIDEEVEKTSEHVVNLYQPDVDVEISSCDIASIASTQEVVEQLDTNDISDIILFDDEGLSYLESIGPRIRETRDSENKAIDEVPTTFDFVDGRHFDSDHLVDELVVSKVIVEPEFDKSVLPVEDNIVIPINCDEAIAAAEIIEETAEDREILNALEPFELKPVEIWPDETSSEINDNGVLHVMLDSSDAAICFSDRTVQFAPVIEKVMSEKIEDTIEKKPEPKMAGSVKPMTAPVHPFRPVTPLRTPIKPIEVTVPVADETVAPVMEEKPQLIINKPLHEINASSQRKDIAPIKVDTRRKFDLKRFNVGRTYNGKLSSLEAFEKGLTNVAPTVSPIANMTVDERLPDWLRRKKERELKNEGYSTLQTKKVGEPEAHERKVVKVDTFTLKRSRRKEESETVSSSMVDEDIKAKVIKPSAPIAPVKPVKDDNQTTVTAEVSKQAVNEIKPIAIKPLTPIKKTEVAAKNVIKPLMPKKVNSQVEKKEFTKPLKPIKPIGKPKH